MAKNPKILELCTALAEKFPRLPSKANGCFELEIPHWRNCCRQFPKGALTEVHGSPANGALLVQALLESSYHQKSFAALIDGRSSFAPDSCEHISHLLWILCTTVEQALRTADLLLRDGNLPLIILDLQMNPMPQLRRIPASTWYRLQRLMEQTAATFVAITPRVLVPCASLRMRMESRWNIGAMRCRREALRGQLQVTLERERMQIPDLQLHIA